jgi:hypothetical protein
LIADSFSVDRPVTWSLEFIRLVKSQPSEPSVFLSSFHIYRTFAAIMANAPPGAKQYVEIFHSKPSWPRAYIQFRTATGEWADPHDAPLSYAEHVREGFRVYRMAYTGRPLDFVVTNGTSRAWDSPPDGQDCYRIDHPGRFVVEHNIRRVGDADPVECERFLVHSKDANIQVSFIADLWEKCYCAYSTDGTDWVRAPGKEMALIETNPRTFSITVPAKMIVFAFNNGGAEPVWDSNHGQNVCIEYVMYPSKNRWIDPLESTGFLSSDELRFRILSSPCI